MTNPPWQPPGAHPPPYGGPPPQQPYQQAPPPQVPYPPQAPFPQQPPAPYGQQPYPGGGWGQPPMGPSPQKNRGKPVAIAIAAVVFAAGVIGVLRGMSDGGGSNSSSAAASPEYELRLPKTLDNGTYTLGDDLSRMMDDKVPDHGSYEHGVKPVSGQYTAGTGTQTRALVFTGYFGTFDDPERSKSSFLHGVSEGDGAEVPIPPKDFTPAGSDEPVTCEVLVKHQSGQDISVPVCVWVDNGALGSVLESDATSMGAAPASIDLQSFADKTGRIRDEVRVPRS
ncbi:hypothetical protein [Streptomyces meridianus]|uniref:Uncharacterized protein n=1 Tax=Streptomyces meridianus TaxID=2938945 RepID=A0ABT0XA80_9ACTN|nr:hypothetical protein [Streptomyces meridianus]MCM2578704.1 hypothetical protein [Streptomyces meridianus]